jgi:hypothetical protein
MLQRCNTRMLQPAAAPQPAAAVIGLRRCSLDGFAFGGISAVAAQLRPMRGARTVHRVKSTQRSPAQQRGVSHGFGCLFVCFKVDFAENLSAELRRLILDVRTHGHSPLASRLEIQSSNAVLLKHKRPCPCPCPCPSAASRGLMTHRLATVQSLAAIGPFSKDACTAPSSVAWLRVARCGFACVRACEVCVRMFACVRAYVCMFACLHVCVLACVHASMAACIHACMVACMHACMFARLACLHANMQACMHATILHTCRECALPTACVSHRIPCAQMVSSDARARPSAAHIVECECAERCAECLIAPQRESPLTHGPVAQRDDAPGFHAQCGTHARTCGAATQRKRSVGGFYIARPRLAPFIYSATAQLGGFRSFDRNSTVRRSAAPCAAHTHRTFAVQHAACDVRTAAL